MNRSSEIDPHKDKNPKPPMKSFLKSLDPPAPNLENAPSIVRKAFAPDAISDRLKGMYKNQTDISLDDDSIVADSRMP